MKWVETVPDLLRMHDGDLPCLGAPGRKVMSRAELALLAARMGGALRSMGIGQSDAVAIVMPNGPEMAAVFLAVSSWAAAAPLNAAYRADEFDFYLGDLDAKALIILRGGESPAREVADRRGIPTIEITPDIEGPAGSFTSSVPFEDSGSPEPSPDDIALVLHTSGTTSRPKLVPLSHQNLVASARSIASTLALSPEDRGLVIMPLFHIHGLVAALLSPLFAGSSVFCPDGFNALTFYRWLDESQATWYTAVPTMHQAVLARAQRNTDIIKKSRMRFIRSSSASLAPQIMEQLEATFGCPVIEAYGMTEAAHQMASNPLPPMPRKPGHVGLAAGPEIAVMSADGTFLGNGETGEIVIRGASVMRGYRENPEANAEAFVDGWFRTGDEGVIDADGYLKLSGRLKEIINRGGEKIAPREVDEVLMDHPSVVQAVTFAIPHSKLGEEVAAAVVLAEGAEVAEAVLRAFAAERLADFKVPRKILFLSEIPKGATGKLQRIGLGERLGVNL